MPRQLHRTETSTLIETRLGPVEVQVVGEGPVVVVLHGALGGYDRARVYSLPEAGYRFICLSRPGYLRTPLRVGKSAEQQAEMTAALLDALEIEQAAVMGCSAGGPPAIYFARNFPERCWGLVMGNAINAPLSRLHGLLRPLAKALFGWDWLTWFGVNRIVLYLLRPRLGWQTKGDPAKQIRIREMLRSIHPTSTRNPGFLNDLDQFQQTASYPLEDVTVPTLVVHGTADVVVPYAQGVASASRIPGAEFLSVEGGTHLCFISHQEVVRPALVEFLNKHQPGSVR